MRVLFDGEIFVKQRVGGINRYFQNLISRLPAKITPIVSIRDRDLSGFIRHPKLRQIRYDRKGFPFGTLSLWFEKYYFRVRTRTCRPDIIHPTYYYSLSQHYVSKYRCPVVLTVYDMIHEKVLNVPPDRAIVKRKQDAISRADAILCISENTKRDLMEYYHIGEEKITVTPLAADIDYTHSHGDERTPKKPYFLYIGYRSSYKNFDGLLEAFAKVALKKKEVVLGVVGSPFNKDEKGRMAELNILDRIEFLGSVDDKHLAKLYRCSIALVYPSLYEGFGIPLLEAMACKTPVIASNCSSIPEVVGDAGILFDPKAIDDLADILINLPNDNTKRKQLIEKGYKRSKLFSWEKTIKKTVDVYQSII